MKDVICHIVEDEHLATEKLSHYIDKIVGIQLGRCFKTVESFLEKGNDVSPGILFVDIQLPGINGLALASQKDIQDRFKIIFVTAYSEYAVDGFNLNAIDYLLKPYSFERFFEAIEKAKKKSFESIPSFQLIKDGQKTHRIPIDQIEFIEGYKEYIRWHTQKGKILELNSLKRVVQQLNKEGFSQIHKSYIVNLNKVDSFDSSHVYVGGNALPIGRKFKASILSQLIG